MKRPRFAYRSFAAALAVALMQFVAAPAAAATTYTYTGSPFYICGFGCPANAPSNWQSDYGIATLMFSAPLPPNLPLTDVRGSLTSWTLRDAFGYVSKSSAAGNVLLEFQVSTDINGHIAEYVMHSEVTPGYSIG